MATFKGIDEAIVRLAQFNDSVVRRAMGGEVKQSEAAKLLGCAPSVISDYKEESLLRACQLLAAFNLKIVHRDEKTYKPEIITALRTFAREGIDVEPETDWGSLS